MAQGGLDLSASRRTLFSALVAAAGEYGAAKIALEDQDRFPMTYRRLILGALVLGRKLAVLAPERANVGVMLPSAIGNVVTFFALTAFGRVPALLNFTAGIRNLNFACEDARIGVIVTSRRFVSEAKLDDLVDALEEGRRVVYLEDLRDSVGILDKARGAIEATLVRFLPQRAPVRPDDPAVVLFTSGSEGRPKGIILSHANVLANVAQLRAHAGPHFTPREVIFNPLPLFHSFGLTAGTMLGLIAGMKVVLYPSPLHYKQVARLIRETKATILLATDTFLQGYLRAAPEDLKGLRFAIAGAERVKDETRRRWAELGVTVLEGYGATECSPVLACNLPERWKAGSVGRLLPGIDFRLEPVEGIAEGGRLLVRGPNVMLGTLSEGGLTPPPGGWHDTGDIVVVDENGFVTIRGRAKRFAKVGGEMVSLAAVEALAAQLWPDATHVAVAVPDARKGEQLVLVTDRGDADRAALQAFAQAHDVPELWLPRAVMSVSAIPTMASGKVDHPATREMVLRHRGMI